MNNKELIEALNKVLDLHNRMRNAYFFTPPANSSKRREYEESHSLVTIFDFEGDHIKIEQITKCSCSNVYYSVNYYVNSNGVKKSIRFVKKILKSLEVYER